MPTLASINLPPVAGLASGIQPKIVNAQPAGSYTSPPQNLPVFSMSNYYLHIINKLDPNTRIDDTITHYVYPVPSSGAPTITLHQRVLTSSLLLDCINYHLKYFQLEGIHKLLLPGMYDVYYEQTNASNTYTVISQNLRFIVQ